MENNSDQDRPIGLPPLTRTRPQNGRNGLPPLSAPPTGILSLAVVAKIY